MTDMGTTRMRLGQTVCDARYTSMTIKDEVGMHHKVYGIYVKCSFTRRVKQKMRLCGSDNVMAKLAYLHRRQMAVSTHSKYLFVFL